MFKTKLVLILFFALLLNSCSSFITRYNYKTDIYKQTKEQSTYQERLFGRYNHYFENDNLKLYMDIEPYAIGFQFQNKLENPLRIIWDSAKVVLEYERIYKISNNLRNISNEFVDIYWQIKNDTILCSIKNKTQNKMLFEKDSGFVKIGEEFRYNISNLALKNYKDNFIKLNWSFYADSANLTLVNISKYAYTLIEDDGKICFNKSKEFQITHKDLRQEKLSLPDSTDDKYYETANLIEMQKTDSLFSIRPTILLPAAIFSDEIIPITNSFYPYSDNNKYELEFSSIGFVNSKMALILPIKNGEEIIYYNFPFRINGYQILRKG